MTGDTWDVIVIGAGATGENVADRVVKNGLTAVIVENELVGGECSYWACMPSKALLRSGIALRAAKKVGGAKEAVTGDLDVAAVFARRDGFTSNWQDDGQEKWLAGAGIDLVRGRGRITGERTVTVTGEDGSTRRLTATQAVVVSTGSMAVLPDIPGLAEVRAWTSREATSAKRAPASLAIVGGGVVASEMATAYASFGTSVTLLARGRLLSGQEPFAGELVAEALRGLGATVRTGVSPIAARRDAGFVLLELDDGSEVRAEELLVATGRRARTDDVGLESIGLTPGEWLSTDDTLLVHGFDWLYAAGDVNHRALLTHQGKYQARAVGDAIAARAEGAPILDAAWGAHVATADHAAVPQVTFTDPEVASVGLTADAARKAGYDIRIVDYDLGNVSGSSLQADGYEGRTRMVVDERRMVLIGMTFVGQDVAELLHAATIAIVGEVPIHRLWHAVPAYPTMNEIWLRLLEEYRDGSTQRTRG
ncbi:MAG TPA: NAD(P)/FAD-dependent oxidoreductase [Leifsonia sp.]|jgi:pyruvate/2-oxoglutarate dehydrogenase complex dihydrolipoamide dehydrogenase (E3) component|nr:pyridine nucleotide-disulfide oxidoreductase dimerization subunit [Microbacteriaceae bacterium]HEV7812630.1 NAD(P)/FAD-dependent oxidoreductase [Leifsonia sp.]